VLELERHLGGGMRQRQILQADETGERATASEAAHLAWQQRRERALTAGKVASLTVQTMSEAAPTVNAGWAPVAIEDTGVDRAGRPRGKRFGVLVHAVLAGIDLAANDAEIRALAGSHGRLVGASRDEIDAAIVATAAALRHPLMRRAAAASALRREVPVAMSTTEGLLEGIVDLAFAEAGTWTVVDYKTDAELAGQQQTYEMQVRLYALAIANATGEPANPALLIV